MAEMVLRINSTGSDASLLRGRLAIAALDLAWAAPALGLTLSLLGGEGARAAGAAVALYLVGLVLAFAGARLAVSPRRRRAATVALAAPGAAAVVVAVWSVAHSAWPLLDGAWVAEALAAMADARLGLWTDLALLIAGSLFVWRGSWLVGVRPGHAVAGASFQIGALVVALGAGVGGQAYAGFALIWALAVLGAGLLALAATHAVDAGPGGAGARLWGLLFTAILLLTVYAFVSCGGVIAATLLDLATRVAHVVADAVGTLFAWLASLFPPEPATLPVDAQPSARGAGEPAISFFTVPESVRRLGGAVVMLGLFVPLLIGAVRYLAEGWRRLWDPLFMAGMRVERGEGFDGGPGRWLRALLYRLGRLLWRGAGGQALDGDPRAWPVRLAYCDLLKAAAKRGAGRLPGQTAAEHLRRLALAFPGHEDELRSITTTYERARYGPAPERELASPLRALVRQVLRRQRRAAVPSTPALPEREPHR